jgi:serine/threonine protein kinase
MQHRPGGFARGPPPSGAAPRPPTSAAPSAPSTGLHTIGSAGIAAPDAHVAKQPAPVMSREATKAAEITLAQNALDTYSAAESVGRYKLAKLIGKGAYGAVYASSDDWNGGSKVAVKHIINAFVSPTDARRIYREVKVMAHFSHPNILPMLDVVKPRDASSFSHIYLVTDLMETDMHKVIHSRQDLTSDHISYFVYQILCALKHIHTAGVLHRDLKPSNLLVNADCTVKMCDFGLARESEPSMSAAFTEYVVTRWYRG